MLRKWDWKLLCRHAIKKELISYLINKHGLNLFMKNFFSQVALTNNCE